jgi:hypothetical protein
MARKISGLVTILFIAAVSGFAQPKPMSWAEPRAIHLAARLTSLGATPRIAPDRPEAKRKQAVALEPDGIMALSAAAASDDGLEMSMRLFDDVELTLVLHRDIASGPAVWTGTVKSRDDSSAVLSVTDGELFGNIRVGSAWYQLQSAGGTVAVYEMDERKFAQMPEDRDVAVPPDLGPMPAAPDPAAADDGSIIDVGVLYTPRALAKAGSTAAMTNLINVAVSETNQAYANSGVIQRLRLVYAALTNYDELNTAGDPDSPDVFKVALKRLANPSDGFMDEAHSLREQYKADLTALLIDNTDLCGLAYLGATGSGDPRLGFAVVSSTCATGYYSFGHELGHNMGLSHDRANGVGLTPARPYGYGYQDPAGRFRTIMAYSDGCPGTCPRIQHFSSPAVSYNGLPTGVANTFSNSANAAQTLNETRTIVANFRQSGGPPQPPGGFTLGDHATAKSMDGGVPATRTNTFSPTDANVFAWLKLDGFSGHHTVQFRFYSPDSSLFWASGVGDYTGDGRSWNFWIGMQISGTDAARKLGSWRAQSVVDGNVVATDAFTIAAQVTCAPDTTTLCLAGDRFAVTTTWRTNDGRTGNGQAVRLTSDTGYFTFFSASNVEAVVKVLDACGLSQRFWVFAGGLTNVNVVLTVRDTRTGAVKTYTNPLNTAFAPVQDTGAFATCQ